MVQTATREDMMRHLLSIVLSLLFAALVYVLIGIGSVKATAGLSQLDHDKARAYTNLVVAVIALAAAGVLYGILVLARLSPLGTVLAGLVLVGVTAWAWFARGSFDHTVPFTILRVRGAGRAGAGTTTLVPSIPLLFTLFSPRRWRRRANPVPAAPAPYQAPPAYAGGPDQPTTQVSGAPTYSTPAHDAPRYEPQPQWQSEPATPTDLFGNSSTDRPDQTRRL